MPAMTMSRASVRPMASAKVQKVQAPKPQKVNFGAAAAAVFTAAFLVASPVFAAEGDVKAAVCASNPTAKVCLKNSAK